MNDLVDFRSPFAGDGRKSFEAWCGKHNLDFSEEYKKLSEYLATFPLKVHRHSAPIASTWLDWYLGSECHQRNIARGIK